MTEPDSELGLAEQYCDSGGASDRGVERTVVELIKGPADE
jgi:hypothetical protein